LVDHFDLTKFSPKFLYSASDNGPHVHLQIIAVDTKKISFFIKKGRFNLTDRTEQNRTVHEKKLIEHFIDQFFTKPLPVPVRTTINFINHEIFAYFNFFVDQN
jgi:hypothetical protein